MFRIVRIHDDATQSAKSAIDAALEFLRERSGVSESAGELVRESMRAPAVAGVRSILLVAQRREHSVEGLALIRLLPEASLCLLSLIVGATPSLRGRVGTALYERVRDEATALGADTVVLGQPVDDESSRRTKAGGRAAASRLRFFERYRVRRLTNDRYAARIHRKGQPGRALLIDTLGTDRRVTRAWCRRAIRLAAEHEHDKRIPAKQLDAFIDPAVLGRAPDARPPGAGKAAAQAVELERAAEPICFVVTDKHAIHRVRDKGYAESPVRIQKILDGLRGLEVLEPARPRRFPERHITELHDPGYIRYFKKVCKDLEPGQSVYPYVFPVRNRHRRPTTLPLSAGFYCIDTFTPLNRNAFTAARRAVDCALTAADAVLNGRRLAYALVRPPGHHAERETFGGFCYFNNAGIAANLLAKAGRVAMLDIDYHHGNGQQDIFYERRDVLTISIHGHPQFEYPYFTGFSEEKGKGVGRDFNLNLPMRQNVAGDHYRKTLAKAVRRIERFRPDFLVVALGVDTARNDPTGTWLLSEDDFEMNGEMIGAMGLPTVVTQEGGYSTAVIGGLVRRFLTGLWKGAFSATR